MTEKAGQNLIELMTRGVSIETAPGGGVLWVSKLDLPTSVRIARALTLAIDAGPDGRSTYRPEEFPSEEQLIGEAMHRMDRESQVFGETRPANRNMAVRVEERMGNFRMTADLRNAYEDHPELGGARLLQVGFVAALDTLDLQTS
jgi:hypothetical protein